MLVAAAASVAQAWSPALQVPTAAAVVSADYPQLNTASPTALARQDSPCSGRPGAGGLYETPGNCPVRSDSVELDITNRGAAIDVTSKSVWLLRRMALFTA
ncbi:hypothetical protein GCM10009764_70530 [Nocardia ninae]|uniref:Uncharacterized protein n=1 Tax=Nocardia ninae NBRC 108245 TaxID=1210091 RepID=A0A511MIW8_9NOCA|nr:hypothetical protein NN4_49200 [Nocardia ninae NBRC 108245]